MYRLIRETSEDRWEVEALYDLCFAPGREALSPRACARGRQPWKKALCRRGARNRRPSLPVRSALPVRDGPRRGAALRSRCARCNPTRQAYGLGVMLMREGLVAAPARRPLAAGPLGGRMRLLRWRFGSPPPVLEGVEMPPPTNPARVLGGASGTEVTGRVTPLGTLEFACSSCAKPVPTFCATCFSRAAGRRSSRRPSRRSSSPGRGCCRW